MLVRGFNEWWRGDYKKILDPMFNQDIALHQNALMNIPFDAIKKELPNLINTINSRFFRMKMNVNQKVYILLILALVRSGREEYGVNGNPQESLYFVNQATQLLPQNGGELSDVLADLYVDIGYIYLQSGFNFTVNEADISHIFTAAVHFNPRNKSAWNNLGIYNAQINQYNEAIVAYQHAIALDSSNATPYNGIGNVYYVLNQYDAAMAAYWQAVALDPTLMAPYYGLGNVYYALNQYDAAMAAYWQAVALDPTDAMSQNGLGNVYYILDPMNCTHGRARSGRLPR